MNITKIFGLDKTALLLSRVVRSGRLGKTIRNLRFKYIVRKIEKFMYDYNFCATRKKGVTDLQLYRAFEPDRRKKKMDNLKYKMFLIRSK